MPDRVAQTCHTPGCDEPTVRGTIRCERCYRAVFDNYRPGVYGRTGGRGRKAAEQDDADDDDDV